VVFSNQSGVARGMFAEDAVHAVNARMDEQLLDANPGAVVDRHEFCPFHPEATVEAYRQDSPLRKPRPGMILQAAEKLALDLSHSWVVGDAPRDAEAGHAAGCRTILVRDPSLPPSPAANSASDVEPAFVVGSLREAISTIARETQGAAPERPAEQEPVVAPAPKTPKTRPEPPVAPAAKQRPAELVVAPEPAATPPAAAPAETPPPSSARARPTPPPEDRDPAPAPPAAQSPPSTEGVEALLEQILMELRRETERNHSDFSVSKLLAGIMQPVALAVLIYAYFRQGTPQVATLLTALILQTFTVALLIMGRQR
jgi:histidinol-phosphate phosphatase family protein